MTSVRGAGRWSLHAHAVLAQQPEPGVELRVRVVSMPPSPVVSTLRGWNEKQTMSPCGRPIRSTPPSQQDLAADGAGGVLDHRQAVRVGDREDRRADRRACPSGGRRGSPWSAAVIAARDQRGVDVAGRRARCRRRPARAAVADGVRRGDEGVADGDHLVAGADAEASSARCRAAVQFDTAQAWSAPTSAANSCSKAATSGPWVSQPERIAAPRRPPPARPSPAEQAGSGGAIGVIDAVSLVPTSSAAAAARHQSTRSREPASQVDLGREAELSRAVAVSARRRGTGFTARSGPYSGAAIGRPSPARARAARSTRLVSVPLATLKTSSRRRPPAPPGCWRGRRRSTWMKSIVCSAVAEDERRRPASMRSIQRTITSV